MSKPAQEAPQPIEPQPVPTWLWFFCYALVGSAGAINAVLITLAIPAMAAYGYHGMLIAALIGMIAAIPVAIWMARRIHRGINS